MCLQDEVTSSLVPSMLVVSRQNDMVSKFILLYRWTTREKNYSWNLFSQYDTKSSENDKTRVSSTLESSEREKYSANTKLVFLGLFYKCPPTVSCAVLRRTRLSSIHAVISGECLSVLRCCAGFAFVNSDWYFQSFTSSQPTSSGSLYESFRGLVGLSPKNILLILVQKNTNTSLFFSGETSRVSYATRNPEASRFCHTGNNAWKSIIIYLLTTKIDMVVSRPVLIKLPIGT